MRFKIIYQGSPRKRLQTAELWHFVDTNMMNNYGAIAFRARVLDKSSISLALERLDVRNVYHEISIKTEVWFFPATATSRQGLF